MSKFRFLDLSGYMFSGKGAVHDFLSEIEGIWTPGNRLEFDLLRVKDGIADLENAITSWSPIRSDEAARRFLRVVRKMASSNAGFRRLFVPGFEYGSRYPRLPELAEKFIRSITVRQWSMYWPYHLLDMQPLEILAFKLKRKLFGVNDNISYRLISGEHFLNLLREFLGELLSYGVDDSDYHTIVMNNAFEPFDPERFINYFHDARCIVVDRDPRDIFATANTFSHGFNDQVHLYRQIAGAFDANVFIDRIKVYRNHISKLDSPKVLRISFEDMVKNYEHTASRIYAFLEIDPSAHLRKLAKFDPKRSESNIGLWRHLPDQNAIRLIERAFFE